MGANSFTPRNQQTPRSLEDSGERTDGKMETHEITDHNETEEGSSDTVTDVIGKKWRDCTPAERRAGIEYPKADFRASGPQPHLALQDGDLEQREGIAVLKEHEAAAHNCPDRWLFDEGELALSANVGETPAPLGITVGRWKVRTDGSREGFDDIEWASCPRTGG